MQANPGQSPHSCSHTDTLMFSHIQAHTTPPLGRETNKVRTLVHVVEARDLEHLAAMPLQLQPHG